MHLTTSSMIFTAIFSFAALTMAKTEPEDCRTAAYANIAEVDCYYDFDKRGRDFLNYVIQIPPTGQDTDGWCKGIEDNLKGECGKYIDTYEFKHCGEDFRRRTLEYPNDKEYSGIDYNFHWYWKWIEGDDMTTCIEKAIKKATCAAKVEFNRDGCYRRKVIE